MAGNNIFCLDTARPNEIEKLITSTDDGDLLQKVIDSNHYLYYIMLQSSMGGSGAEDVVVSDAARGGRRPCALSMLCSAHWPLPLS